MDELAGEDGSSDCTDYGATGLKYRELIKLLESHGGYVHRQRGSHMIFRHPDRGDSLAVAAGGKLKGDVRPGTLNSILKQAGIKYEKA